MEYVNEPADRVEAQLCGARRHRAARAVQPTLPEPALRLRRLPARPTRGARSRSSRTTRARCGTTPSAPRPGGGADPTQVEELRETAKALEPARLERIESRLAKVDELEAKVEALPQLEERIAALPVLEAKVEAVGGLEAKVTQVDALRRRVETLERPR